MKRIKAFTSRFNIENMLNPCTVNIPLELPNLPEEIKNLWEIAKLE